MKEKHFNLLRWLPVVGSLALVILIAVISMVTVKELNEAVYWRQHTYEISLKAQAEEDDLVHAEGSVRHYAAKGTASLLIEYQNETNSELQEFNELAELTRDNPEQQQRLKELDAAVKAVFDHDKSVIGVFAHQGPEAALKMENQGLDETDTAIHDLEALKDEEKKLLDKRDAAEQADFHKATGVLIAGGILAALLLVLANYFASREMARRRRSEQKQRELIQELQTALAEVKTLSGLIPICGWCKKVRSDEGFWQSVESYVGTHTDATFTHGMCPNCAKQWKADIAMKEQKSNSGVEQV